MSNSRSDSRPPIEGPGLLESVRQYWTIAFALIAFGVLAGAGSTFALSATYESTARVGLKEPAGINGSNGMPRYLASIAQFASSDVVLAPAAKKLGRGTTVDALRGSLTATPDLVGDIVYLTMSSDTPEGAVTRANAMSVALQNALTDRTNKVLQAKLATLTQKITDQQTIINDPKATPGAKQTASNLVQTFTTQTVTLQTDNNSFANGVDFASNGLLPAKGRLRAAALQGAIGGLVGFIFALVACWIIADRRRIVDDAAVAGIITDARLLGEVPTLRGGANAALSKFGDMPAASFEFAAAGLWSSIESGVVMVSGVQVGAGSTTTAANIGAAFARDGRRVVIIDADGTDKSLSKLAGIADGTAGLSDVLTLRSPLEDALRAVDLGDATSVAVLSSGRPEADLASLLRGRSMSETLERLREWYDIVIIDVPPLADAAHGASLARCVDGVLFVVPRGVKMRRIERLRERLDLLAIPVFGYVYNRDQALDASINRTRASSRN